MSENVFFWLAAKTDIQLNYNQATNRKNNY